MPIVAEPAQRHVSSIGTTDQLRRNNLSNILGLLHQSGSFSRAELTRMTGLNRSTVGAVVTDLADLQLVDERMPERGAKAARPSPVVHIDHRTVAIAVNPEVDAVHVGLVSLGGRVLQHVRLEVADTPSAEHVVELATAAIADILSEQDRGLRVVGIGVAVPGQVRLSDGHLREATHMGWLEQPLAAMFERATGHPAWAANAAMLAMRAESTFGAVRNVDDLVYIIGGASGIGGGVLSGGRLVTGAGGYAGGVGPPLVGAGWSPGPPATRQSSATPSCGPAARPATAVRTVASRPRSPSNGCWIPSACTPPRRTCSLPRSPTAPTRRWRHWSHSASVCSASSCATPSTSLTRASWCSPGSPPPCTRRRATTTHWSANRSGLHVRACGFRMPHSVRTSSCWAPRSSSLTSSSPTPPPSSLEAPKPFSQGHAGVAAGDGVVDDAPPLEPVTHRCDDRSGYRAVTKMLLANARLMCVCCCCQQMHGVAAALSRIRSPTREVHDA